LITNRPTTRPSLAKVIVHVSDMQRSVEFYRDSIGLEIESPHDRQGYGEEPWVTFSAGPCTLALRRGVAVDAGADAPKIVIAVDDIESARRRLIDRGIATEIATSPAPGLWVVNVCDPDGNAIAIEAFTTVPGVSRDARVPFTMM
jgi:predicted enzyme related to lactoylglutathione lyase